MYWAEESDFAGYKPYELLPTEPPANCIKGVNITPLETQKHRNTETQKHRNTGTP